MAVPRYHFDLYPRDDPKDGTRLVRFTNLQTAKYRAEANGVGVGEFSIRASDAEAQFIDPRGLQYVRVVEEGVTESERVVGGFWLETGDFAALTEDSTKLLKFGGPGTLAYLSREVLWSRAYNFADDGIIDTSGTWHFYNQTSLAGGDFLGAVLWRVMAEAQSFAASVVEVDDKPDTAIPESATSFGQFNDSAANLWTVPSGEFKAQVGDSIYSIVKRLMEAGLYVEANPDTFVVNAWERGAPSSRGQDKTGAAWATDVLLFKSAPLDGDEAEGNIKSDAKRSVTPFLLASTVLAGDQGVYAAESNALDVAWHRYYPSTVQNTDTLSYMADAQLTARGDAADTLRIRIKLGTDPTIGEYIPLSDYEPSGTEPDGSVMLNDLVTVHTGTSQWDYNLDTFPVSAITISVREGGDWDCWLDLGAAYSSMAERAFQAKGAAPHTHSPNPPFCRHTIPPSATEPIVDYEWAFGSDMVDDTVGAVEWTGAAHWGGAGNGVMRWTGTASADYLYTESPVGTPKLQPDTVYTVNITVTGKDRPQEKIMRMVWLDGANSTIRTDTLTTALGIGSHSFTMAASPSNTGGFRLQISPPEYVELYVSHVSITHGGGVSTGGTLGSGHVDLIGTCPEAARCCHKHHVTRDRPPGNLDDAEDGYPVDTFWIYRADPDDPDSPVAGYFISTDDTTDAAVWQEISSSGGSGGSSVLFEEVDGAPSVSPAVVLVPNGTLTDNGDGSATLALAHSVHSHEPPTPGFHGVLVQRTTNFTTTFSNDSIPDFDTEIYDTDGLWEGVTNPDRITIPAGWDGLMAVFHARAGWSGHTDTYVEMKLYRNGTADEANIVAVTQHATNAASPFQELTSPPIQVAEGDYFTITFKTPASRTLIQYEGASILFGAYLVGSGGGGAVTEEDVRDAGRWEVLLTEDGSEPITTEDGLDWLYVWVTD